MNRWARGGCALMMAAVAGSLGGCKGLLRVPDPEVYTESALNSPQALGAVANGVEGEFDGTFSGLVLAVALSTDEYQHTGTWNPWDEVSKGEDRAGIPNYTTDDPFDGLVRTRWAAQDAESRFSKVMGDTASKSLLMARVQTVEGMTDLYLGMNYCEAPDSANGPAVDSKTLIQMAITVLGKAEQTAQAVGTAGGAQATFVTALLARANLLAGNLAQAASLAASVPPGFEKDALYSGASGSEYNSVVSLTNYAFNQAAGLRDVWWSQVDTINGYLRDPVSGQDDPRMPIVHKPGAVGVDGFSPYYSENKYTGLGSSIPITSWLEMRLIQAEVAMRQGDLPTAVSMINEVRTSVGLPPYVNPGNAAAVQNQLLYERFATLFLEAQRLQDLYRFNLMGQILGPNRPTLMPISFNEVQANSQINFPRSCPALSQ